MNNAIDLYFKTNNLLTNNEENEPELNVIEVFTDDTENLDPNSFDYFFKSQVKSNPIKDNLERIR